MQPTNNHFDIAIIGGGMVGAALAALLSAAQKRWRIALIESFPLPTESSPHFQPSFDDRSTAIAEGSVELLRAAGVWEQLAQRATAIKQVHVSDKGHLGGSLISADQAGVNAVGHVIPNGWIGRVLISQLRELDNVTLIAPNKVERLVPIRDGAELQLQDGETLCTQLAVIADGANSTLCRQLGIVATIEDYHQTAIIANVSYSQSHQGVAFERFTDQGPLALLPLGLNSEAKQSALVWTHPRQQADEILALDDREFLALLQQRFGHRLGEFTKVGKRDSYELQLSEANEQVRSSLVVMGNAAHFLHPVAGQGFNLALRDCAALADTLKTAGDLPLGQLSLLQKYLDRQRLDQQATIHFSDQLTKLFSNNRLPEAAARALGFVGLDFLPLAKTLLTQQTMGQGGPQYHINSSQ